MTQFNDVWMEHQRQRFIRPDAHRYIRADAYRFAPPGSPRYSGEDVIRYCWPADQQRNQRKDASRLAESKSAAANFDPATEAELLQLRAECASLRLEWELQKFAAKERKANFNPAQPRDELGRWTEAGGGTLSNPPDIPNEMPETAQLRNRLIKEAAIWLAKAALREAANPVVGTFLNVLDAALWIQEGYPYIRAYLDQPKSLDELQQAVSAPQKGYDVHHIVEKTPAAQDGFPRSLIDGPDNLVRIPTLKHWEVNRWYETKNMNYGGVTPRIYVRDKDWEERRTVGVRALVEAGVLKP